MMVNERKNGCSKQIARAIYGATIGLDRFGFKRFLKKVRINQPWAGVNPAICYQPPLGDTRFR